MKKRTSVALSLLLGWSLLTTEAASAEDNSSYWGSEYLTYAVEHGLLKGDEKGNLHPEKNISRAEFATILVRALELQPLETDYKNFADVAEKAWYYEAIKTAYQHGLVYGVSATAFAPTAPISRQEMATMIYRAVEKKGIASASLTLMFDDKSKIATWAAPSIQRVLSLGLMQGRTESTFAPMEQSKRVEAVAVIKRFLEIDPENPIKVGQQFIDKQYETDYETALTSQSKATPKVDGGGAFIASKELISYYMNPGTFDKVSPEYFQFLKLDAVVENLDANTLNAKAFNYPEGTLYNQAQTFIDVAKNLNMNALYLMAHALHETNNGRSKLAMGVEVGVNASKQATMVTDENRSELTGIKVVYNMYGIQAVDSNPLVRGSQHAYNQGWFTPELAIEGGAKFIQKTYIVDRGQNTLYKMRWNPMRPATYQYATHVQWAEIQARKIYNFYETTGANQTTVAVFEVPTYANQPAPTALPTKDQWYAIGTKNAGKTAVVTTSALNVRSYPDTTTQSNLIGSFLKDTEITINGDNGVWYNVTYNGLTGWVHSMYLTIK
jgi:beta-N-acetylglucosaminidase